MQNDTVQTENRGDVKIRPTVLIGLGGSGKDVMLRVRRIMYEKYRTRGLPVMRYIWADTDTDFRTLGAGLDIVDKQVEFDGNERVPLSVDAPTLERLYNNPDANQNIFSWYPLEFKNLMEGASLLTHGAGQIRAGGRLALHLHRAAFVDKVKRMYEEVSNTASKSAAERLGFDVDPAEREVILICSMAGGTGSGSFIDAAFMIKQAIPGVRVTGILFVPSVFERILEKDEDRRILGANGYAAFMELDYYMSSVGWKDPTLLNILDREASRPIMEPPFDAVYLVDRQNEGGIHYNDAMQPFQMVAESLSLEFDRSDFSKKKRSHRSNMHQHMSEYAIQKGAIPSPDPNASDGQTKNVDNLHYPRIYATFGMAGLFIDQDRIRNAGAYLLGELLCDFMLGTWKGLQELKKSFEVQLEEAGMTAPGLFRSLLDDGTGNNLVQSHWESEIGESFKRISNQVNVAFGEDQWEDVSDFVMGVDQEIGKVRDAVLALDRKVREEASRKWLRDKGETNELGEHWTRISRNVGVFEEEIKKKLKERMLSCLQDPVHYGVEAGEQLIDGARDALDELIRDLEQTTELEDLKSLALPTTEEAGGLVDAKQMIEAAREIPIWFGGYRKVGQSIANRQFETFRADYIPELHAKFRGYLKEAEQRIWRNLEIQYRRAAFQAINHFKLVERLRAFIGEGIIKTAGKDGKKHQVTGLHAELHAYRNRVHQLGDQCQSFFKAFSRKKADTDERNYYLEGDLVFDQEVFDYLKQKFNVSMRDPKDIMLKTLHAFFPEVAGLSPEYQRKWEDERYEEFLGELTTEGMRAVYQVAAAADREPARWKKVERSLLGFCFKTMGDFHYGETARSAMGKLEEEDLNKRIADVMSRARPWAKRSATQSLDGVDPHMLRVFTLSDSDDELYQKITSNRISGGGSSYNPADAVNHHNASLLFYNEAVALPCYYFQCLEDMRKHYNDHLRGQGVYSRLKRHIDRRSGKFRDVMPPATSGDWQKRWTAHLQLSKAVILGTVKFTGGSSEGFRYEKRQGFDREEFPLGISLDQATQLLADSPEDFNNVAELNNAAFNELPGKANNNGLLHYVLALRHYQKMVYPSTQAKIMRLIAIDFLLDEAIEIIKTFYGPLPGESEDDYRDRIQKDHLSRIRLRTTEIDYTDWATEAKPVVLSL